MPATKNRKNTKWHRGYGAIDESRFVNFTMIAPFAMVDEIEEIARQLRVHLELESIPEQFKTVVYPLDEVVFGYADRLLNNICENYTLGRLRWYLTNRVLRFAVLTNGAKSLSKFDELAGHLMAEAKRGANDRLDSSEYAKIAAELDKAGFAPLEHMEGEYRKILASYNQRYSLRPIRTFQQALSNRTPTGKLIKRGVLRRLARAKSKWRQSHPEA